MSSKLAPTATFTLDRERTLIVDMGALVRFKQATGKSLITDLADILRDFGEDKVVALIWASLSTREKPRLTYDEFLEIFPPGRLTEATTTVFTLLGVSLPEAPADADAEGEGEGGERPLELTAA